MVVKDQFFSIEAGEKKTLRFTLTDDTDPDNPVPLDVTNLDLDFLVGPAELACGETNTAVIRKQSTVGDTEIEKVTPTQGIVDVKLVNADSTSLCGGFTWVLRAVASAEPFLAASGTCIIDPKIVPAS